MVGAPAASEFAILCAAIGAGEFHGTRLSAGPQGSRCTSTGLPVGPSYVASTIPARSCSAARRNEPPTITAASIVVVLMFTAEPRASSSAIRPACWSSASATESRTAARSAGGVEDHVPARCSRSAAAATRSTSGSLEATWRAIGRAVLGFSSAMPRSTVASLHSPMERAGAARGSRRRPRGCRGGLWDSSPEGTLAATCTGPSGPRGSQGTRRVGSGSIRVPDAVRTRTSTPSR